MGELKEMVVSKTTNTVKLANAIALNIGNNGIKITAIGVQAVANAVYGISTATAILEKKNLHLISRSKFITVKEKNSGKDVSAIEFKLTIK